MMPAVARKVLVVDDDDAIRTGVSWVLAEFGYEALMAENGQVALERVLAEQPALVLLDVHMPVMDGWEFARRYRELPGPHAPIVVMTATQDVQERTLQGHADGYLTKPFGVKDLMAVVRCYIPL